MSAARFLCEFCNQKEVIFISPVEDFIYDYVMVCAECADTGELFFYVRDALQPIHSKMGQEILARRLAMALTHGLTQDDF